MNAIPIAAHGSAPDHVVAARHGVSRSAARRARVRAGVGRYGACYALAVDLDLVAWWLAGQYEPVSTAAVAAAFGWPARSARRRLRVAEGAGAVLCLRGGPGLLWVAA